jgi:hypothetical protein
MAHGGQDKSAINTRLLLVLSEVISFDAAAAAVSLIPVRTCYMQQQQVIHLLYQKVLYQFLLQ